MKKTEEKFKLRHSTPSHPAKMRVSAEEEHPMDFISFSAQTLCLSRHPSPLNIKNRIIVQQKFIFFLTFLRIQLGLNLKRQL